MEPSRRQSSPADYAKLATYLEALANPGRLALLHQLRQPRAVTDIELKPSAAGARPERNISRQAVRKQLAKLEEAGLILRQAARRDGAAVEEHVVNHPMLFAVMEELRQVTRLRPVLPPAPAATMTASRGQPRSAFQGPRIVMVHGPFEGQTYPLEPARKDDGRGWLIGRRRGLAVSLDHDPFVSGEHAEVVHRPGEGFVLLDLKTNKNGTELNWAPLERGGNAPLRSGDIIGVGGTLLLFRQD